MSSKMDSTSSLDLVFAERTVGGDHRQGLDLIRFMWPSTTSTLDLPASVSVSVPAPAAPNTEDASARAAYLYNSISAPELVDLFPPFGAGPNGHVVHSEPTQAPPHHDISRADRTL